MTQTVKNALANQAGAFPFVGTLRVRTTYEFRGRRLDDEELEVRSKQKLINDDDADPQTLRSIAEYISTRKLG